MPHLLQRFIAGVFDHWRYRWIEWTLAWLLVSQGVRLVNNHGPINKYYQATYSMLPQDAMGAAAVSIGSIWVVALFLNGTLVASRRASPWMRAVCATLATVYWTFWAVTLHVAAERLGLFTNSWINHATFGFMAFMCLLTLADEVAAVDRKAKRCLQRKIGGR